MSNQWKWKTEEIRFWEKVDKSRGLGPKGRCWEWRGGARGSRKSSLSETFYGGFRYKNKVELAHRVSFIMEYGNIPEGVRVLHRCDNPACVRPNHLWLGSQIDNVRDAWSKGRGFIPNNWARGSEHPRAKFTEKKILKIRARIAEGSSDAELARDYEVSPPAIRAIRLRKTWKHIE